VAINSVLLGLGMLAKTTSIPSTEAAEPTALSRIWCRGRDVRCRSVCWPLGANLREVWIFYAVGGKTCELCTEPCYEGRTGGGVVITGAPPRRDRGRT
jgi:hypothetical protein